MCAVLPGWSEVDWAAISVSHGRLAYRAAPVLENNACVRVLRGASKRRGTGSLQIEIT